MRATDTFIFRDILFPSPPLTEGSLPRSLLRASAQMPGWQLHPKFRRAPTACTSSSLSLPPDEVHVIPYLSNNLRPFCPANLG